MSEKHPLKLGLAVLVAGAVALFVGTYLVTLVMGKNLSLGGEKVAVVEITGVILSSEEVLEQLRKYEKDPSIKAIVVLFAVTPSVASAFVIWSCADA